MTLIILGTAILLGLTSLFFGSAFGLLYLYATGEFDKAEAAGVVDMDGTATELLKGGHRK